MAGHPLTEEFFKETVEPTVDEYLVQPENVRRGRLAAIALNHVVDYWHEDTHESLTVIRAALRDDTPIPGHPGHSSSDVLRDVADASKHAKLNRADSRLTNADQVKKQLIGAMGTAPMGMVPMGMLKAVDTRATLNDGQSFNLAYVVRNAAEVWRKKLGLL